MLRKCKAKLKSRAGFSLSELLVALLILIMAVGIVAEGVPMALNAYGRVVNASNAQVLLSTTMTKLRTELSTAKDVKAEGTTIYFTAPDCTVSIITLKNEEGGSDNGIYLQECVRPANVDADAAWPETTPHLLVSRAAANQGKASSASTLKYLYVTFDGFDGNSYKDGVITFENLAVTDGKNTLANVEQYQIRVLADTATTDPEP